MDFMIDKMTITVQFQEKSYTIPWMRSFFRSYLLDTCGDVVIALLSYQAEKHTSPFTKPKTDHVRCKREKMFSKVFVCSQGKEGVDGVVEGDGYIMSWSCPDVSMYFDQVTLPSPPSTSGLERRGEGYPDHVSYPSPLPSTPQLGLVGGPYCLVMLMGGCLSFLN